MKSDTAFREELRFRVLRLLANEPNLSNREVARRLGVSVGGVHYCLRALADKGMIKIQNFQASDNKMGYAYIVTPKGISERMLLAAAFLQRKRREYDVLIAEIEAATRDVDAQRAAAGASASPVAGDPAP